MSEPTTDPITVEELETVRAAYLKRLDELIATVGEGTAENFPRATRLIPWIERLSLDDLHNIVAIYTIPRAVETLKLLQDLEAVAQHLSDEEPEMAVQSSTLIH